jgi:hypothetical protein
VCNRRYHVNVRLRNGEVPRLDPERACPAFVKVRPDPFRPKAGEEFAEQRIVVPGPKMRGLASADDGERRAGLPAAGILGPGASPSMSLAPVR